MSYALAKISMQRISKDVEVCAPCRARCWFRGAEESVFEDILNIRNDKRVQSIDKMNIWDSETKKKEKERDRWRNEKNA